MALPWVHVFVQCACVGISGISCFAYCLTKYDICSDQEEQCGAAGWLHHHLDNGLPHNLLGAVEGQHHLPSTTPAPSSPPILSPRLPPPTLPSSLSPPPSPSPLCTLPKPPSPRTSLLSRRGPLSSQPALKRSPTDLFLANGITPVYVMCYLLQMSESQVSVSAKKLFTFHRSKRTKCEREGQCWVRRRKIKVFVNCNPFFFFFCGRTLR